MKEARDMLSDEYGRSVRDLFKSFLILIEDLNEEHKSHFSKLKSGLPHEYSPLIEQADYFENLPSTQHQSAHYHLHLSTNQYLN